MNLPLQMGAVSRGRVHKSRIVNAAGRVFPSWEHLCTGGVLCSCPNGMICCGALQSCNCDSVTNMPSCGAGNGHGSYPGTKHHHAEVACYNQSSEVIPPVDCNNI